MKVGFSIKEVYDTLCPKCKAKLEKLATQKLAAASVRQALRGGTRKG